MQLHLVFGFKLYHLGAIPVESYLSKWHVLRLQEEWNNTCCNLVTFYWETPHPQRFAWRTFREGHWVVLKLISLLQILGVQQYPQGGWARYISSGRMSSRTIYGPLHYHGACHLISSGRMSSLHILSEDELWSNSLFFYYYGGCLGRSLGYS